MREVIAVQSTRYAADVNAFDIRGTAFQQQVWQALRTIPCGETVSYQQLANAIGNRKRYGPLQCRKAYNKLAIVIPCHRVVRGDGSLSVVTAGAL